MHELSIQDSAGEVVLVPLQHDRISVGREEGNVIRLTDQNVSRRHARLVRVGGQYFIEDFSSDLGTTVNGVRITERTALHGGDSVVIGEYRLTFRTVGFVTAPSETLTPALVKRPSPVKPAASVAPPVTPAPAVPTSLPERAPAAVQARSSRWWTATMKAIAPAGVESLSSWFKVTMSGHARAPVTVGLPMVAADGPPPPTGGGGGGGPGGRRSEPPEAFTDPTVSVTPLGRQVRRLRATLGLAAMAAIMVTAGVLFAPLVKELHRSPGQAGATGAGSPGETADTLLDELESAIPRQQWADALLLQARLAAVAPSSPRSEELGRKIRNERENSAALEAAERALALQDYATVLSRAGAVGASSVYRDRGRVLVQTARLNLVAQHLRAAQSRQNEGDCSQARKEAAKALALESDNPTGKEILTRCARVAMGQPPKVRPARLLAAARPSRAIPPPPVRALAPTPTPARVQAPPTRSPSVKPPVVTAAPAAAISSQPPPRPSRRVIDSNNPYSGDLP